MSVVQGGADLGLPNLTPEFNKSLDVVDKATESKISEFVENTKQQIEAETKKTQERNSTKEPLTMEQLEKVAQQLQDFVGEMNRGLEFSVDKDSGRDVIKVIDKTSGDLVKQFPSEEVLTLVAKLSEMVGGFVDAKV